jgi:hypothetical protein
VSTLLLKDPGPEGPSLPPFHCNRYRGARLPYTPFTLGLVFAKKDTSSKADRCSLSTQSSLYSNPRH